MVGTLDEPGCTGIRKEWDIGQVVDCGPPLSAALPKISGELLQGSFVCCLVKNQQTALPVACGPQAGKKHIEAAAKILKCYRNGISTTGYGRLFDCASKYTRRIVAARYDLKN